MKILHCRKFRTLGGAIIKDVFICGNFEFVTIICALADLQPLHTIAIPCFPDYVDGYRHVRSLHSTFFFPFFAQFLSSFLLSFPLFLLSSKYTHKRSIGVQQALKLESTISHQQLYQVAILQSCSVQYACSLTQQQSLKHGLALTTSSISCMPKGHSSIGSSFKK